MIIPIYSFTAAGRRYRYQGLKFPEHIVHTRLLWRLVSYFFDFDLGRFSPTTFPIDEESVKYIKIEMGPNSDRYFLSNAYIDAGILCYYYFVI